MAHDKSKRIKRYFIILSIFVALFFFNVSSILASDSSGNAVLVTRSYSISTADENSQVMEYDELYSSIVSNSDLKSSSIEINGMAHGMIELPDDSIAVKLPDE